MTHPTTYSAKRKGDPFAFVLAKLAGILPAPPATSGRLAKILAFLRELTLCRSPRTASKYASCGESYWVGISSDTLSLQSFRTVARIYIQCIIYKGHQNLRQLRMRIRRWICQESDIDHHRMKSAFHTEIRSPTIGTPRTRAQSLGHRPTRGHSSKKCIRVQRERGGGS